LNAQEAIQRLGMEPLKGEGGWFAPVWRSPDDKTVSVIYYLLKKGEVSRWHQLQSHEVWSWCAGGCLEQTLGGTGDWPRAGARRHIGPDSPVAAVPAMEWQSARVVQGEFVLVSCTVAPAYRDEACYLPQPPVEDVEAQRHG